MASNLDFSSGSVLTPGLDRIQRGERMSDNLPRRRFHIKEKPVKKDPDEETQSEDIQVSDEDGTKQRLLDLRV